jgi:predicted permease
LDQAHLDGRALGFTLLLALVTSIVFGIVPALQSSKSGVEASLKEGGRSAAGAAPNRRVFHVLVISEIALAVMLVIGATLLIKSYSRLGAVDPGFNQDSVLTFHVKVPFTVYGGRAWSLIQQLCDRIENTPGVQSVGAGSKAAFPIIGDSNIMDAWAVGRPDPSGSDFPAVKVRQVTNDYFRALGIRLLAGRYLSTRDTQLSSVDANSNQKPSGSNDQGHLAAGVINRAFADRFFPGEDPVGRHIWVGSSDARNDLAVVGVVDNARFNGLGLQDDMAVYCSLSDGRIRAWNNFRIAVRTQGDPKSYIGAIQELLRTLDGDLPISDVRTMNQILSDSISDRRFAMGLLSLLAAVALILAAIGVYGVMSYSVSQRTGEIGIRIALGAQPGELLRLILRQGMILIAAGIAMGLLSAFALIRLMATLLYGVKGTDPVTYALATTLLAGVAILACYVPAWRTLRRDPMGFLRSE